ncbi:hypothetical protein K8R66_01120 [bacterium]|nr:hypothetical protein [bacterium]
MKKIKQKFDDLHSSLKFLSLVILVYLFILAFNPLFFMSSLNRFVILAIKILPSILGAFILIFIFNYILSNKKIKQYLIGKVTWKKYFLIVILGILSSGPIYAWYPFLADLKEQGFKNGLISIFLYNRAIKLPFIPMIAYYFSLKFVILMTALMIIFSVINGIIIDKFIKN